MNEHPAPSKPRSRKAAKFFTWLAVAVMVYTVAGFWIAPVMVKSQLEKRLPEKTFREATVGRVEINPYTLSLTVSDLTLREPDGALFASLAELHANLEAISLMEGKLMLSEVRVKQPIGHITRDANGELNIANLLKKKSGKKEPIKLVVENLLVTNGSVVFTDFLQPELFRSWVVPINVHFSEFSTETGAESSYTVRARTAAGERYYLTGALTLEPLELSGTFTLNSIPLKKYSAYASAFTSAVIGEGMVEAQGDYRLEGKGVPLDIRLSNGRVELFTLGVNAPGSGETVLTMPALAIENIEASLAKRTAGIGSVVATNGVIVARREKDGSINLLKLLPEGKSAPKPAGAKDKESPYAGTWMVNVEKISVTGFDVRVEDRHVDPPASFVLDQVSVKAADVSNQTNSPVKAQISLRWNRTGEIEMDTEADLASKTLIAVVKAAGLDLKPMQPYISERAALVLNSGKASLEGRAEYRVGSPGKMQARFEGDLSISEFSAAETVLNTDFLKWNALALRGIKVETQPAALSLDEARFHGLQASVVINTNREINVLKLLKSGPPSASPSQPMVGESPKTPFAIRLKSLVMEDSLLSAVDQSVSPSFDASVKEFGGSIKGLGYPPKQKADLIFSGNIGEQSEFEISGQVLPDPKKLFADVKVSAQGTEMSQFSPYSRKFVGFPIERGRLSVDATYSVDGRQLKGMNNVTLNRLEFGPQTREKPVMDVPVKLGVSLLKDGQGTIKLNFPVSGQIDDPKFSLSEVIAQAAGNFVFKAVTSPFAFLGAIFGGGEDIRHLDFKPGRAAIEPAELSKLDSLSAALRDRPGLSLLITGSASPDADAKALKPIKLENRLKSMRIEELKARGIEPPPLETIKLEPEDYERLLHQVYTNTFGAPAPPALEEKPETATASPTNQAAVVGIPQQPSDLAPVETRTRPPGAQTDPATEAPPTKPTEMEKKPAPSAPTYRQPGVTKGAARLLQLAGRSTPRKTEKKPEPKPVAKTEPVEEEPAPPPPVSAPREPVATKTPTPTEPRTELSAAPPVVAQPDAAPAAPPTPTRAEMEEKLLAQIQVTDADLSNLMQARAEKVRQLLLDSAKVSPERLSADTAQGTEQFGKARVIFSLKK